MSMKEAWENIVASEEFMLFLQSVWYGFGQAGVA